MNYRLLALEINNAQKSVYIKLFIAYAELYYFSIAEMFQEDISITMWRKLLELSVWVTLVLVTLVIILTEP